MGPDRRPDAEIEIDSQLVEALVVDQHPDLVGAVLEVASGWDNAVFRLGSDLAVRLPRRELGARLIESELRWLPVLAPRLPLEVPVPVRAGEAGRGYPWRWAIVRWVEGETALAADAGIDEPGVVTAIVAFLEALHRPAPSDVPRNPFRGVPLAERVDRFADHLVALPLDIDRVAVAAVWARALAQPSWAGPPLWVHGDLHPGNLVVRDRRLVGVVDFGDLTGGDPATDLAVAWMILGPDARSALRAQLAADDATWGRARGWALAHACAVLAHSADDRAMAAMARRTLAAVLAD